MTVSNLQCDFTIGIFFSHNRSDQSCVQPVRQLHCSLVRSASPRNSHWSLCQCYFQLHVFTPYIGFIKVVVVGLKIGFSACFFRQKDRECHSIIDWLIDWMTDWLTGWLTDWLAGWLTNLLADLLADWVADWIKDRLTHSLIESLTNLLTECIIACERTNGTLQCFHLHFWKQQQMLLKRHTMTHFAFCCSFSNLANARRSWR